jgi:hypothetical protein
MNYESMPFDWNAPDAEFDFCCLCGGKIWIYYWREHMNIHNVVLKESPKNEDGTWKHQDEYVYDDDSQTLKTTDNV